VALIILLINLLVIVIITAAVFIVLGSFRSKGNVARSLNLSLFLVRLPREKATERPEKELIAISEQLYAAFTNMHAAGWNKFVYGEPYIALEMAVHHLGEEIHFYVAVPKSLEKTFPQQVQGLYPTAEVQRVKDYNIFNPTGAVAGTFLRQTTEPVLPIRTYTSLESDPLNVIATPLSRLEKEGEGAAIQILFRPSHHEDIRTLSQNVAKEMQTGVDFHHALQQARKRSKKKSEANVEAPRQPSPNEAAIIEALQNKASRPLYDVNIRILASADNEARAEQLLHDISSSFVQLAAPNMNSLEPVGMHGKPLESLTFNFIFRMFTPEQNVYLSSEELASVYHFPLPTTTAAKINSLKSKIAEPPTNLPATGVIMGKSVFQGNEQMVRIGDEDRRRHVYVIGQTGTGKSSLMKNMIVQDVQAGKGVCVVDPHGELAQYVLSMVPAERTQDVIYFNPGQMDRPIGLNMLEFDTAKPEQKTFVANELLAIAKSLYGDVPEAFGPMFEQYFKNSVLLLLDAYETRQKNGVASTMPVLAEIPRLLTDTDYRRSLLADTTNPLVKNFWEKEAEKAGGDAALANMAPYITSKLNAFLANDYVRPIVSQHTSAFNFREIIDTSKILVVNLSKGQIGESNAGLLGMIVVGKLLIAALSRSDMNEADRKDFYLYIDEFQTVTTDSIATILSEARKYHLNLTIAHQYIKQLRENIRNAVFGNVGSVIAFRVGADDAEFLKNQFEPVFSASDLINIDNFNAHVKVLIQNQTSRPFNIQTIQEPLGNTEQAGMIAEASAQKYGVARSEIEATIQSQFSTRPIVTP